MSSPLSGDGYFATWACFLASCAFVHQEVAFYRGQFDALKESFVGRGARLRGLLFIASVVCVWESALVCSDIPSALCNGDENAANRLGRLGLVKFPTNDQLAMLSEAEAATPPIACKEINFCVNEYGWAVACSTISLFIALAFMIPPLERVIEPAHKPIYVFLFLWWIAGCGVMTLKAPFLATGNGFFGAWVAVYASTALTYKSIQGWDGGVEGEITGGAQSFGGGGGGAGGFTPPDPVMPTAQPAVVGAV